MTTALALALAGVARLATAGPAPASRELMDRIWRGVDQAQERHTTGCGKLTETRVSPLLARPIVMHGSFCVGGLELFRVAYDGPESPRVTYNRGALNVSVDGGKHIEAFDAGSAVRRAQGYFGGPHATEHLERDFSITVAETADHYSLLLVPVSGRIARRVKRVAVELGKLDFLPRRIEIDGKSGVNSTFDIVIERLDAPLDKGMFEVHRP